jgi:hypothetical protein
MRTKHRQVKKVLQLLIVTKVTGRPGEEQITHNHKQIRRILLYTKSRVTAPRVTENPRGNQSFPEVNSATGNSANSCFASIT